jgi:hypothetical protein
VDVVQGCGVGQVADATGDLDRRRQRQDLPAFTAQKVRYLRFYGSGFRV